MPMPCPWACCAALAGRRSAVPTSAPIDALLHPYALVVAQQPSPLVELIGREEERCVGLEHIDVPNATLFIDRLQGLLGFVELFPRLDESSPAPGRHQIYPDGPRWSRQEFQWLAIEPSHCAKQPHCDAVTVGFFLIPSRAVGVQHVCQGRGVSLSGEHLGVLLEHRQLVTAAAVGLGHDVFGGGGLLLLKVDVGQSNVGAELIWIGGNGTLKQGDGQLVFSELHVGLGKDHCEVDHFRMQLHQLREGIFGIFMTVELGEDVP